MICIAPAGARHSFEVMKSHGHEAMTAAGIRVTDREVLWFVSHILKRHHVADWEAILNIARTTQPEWFHA